MDAYYTIVFRSHFLYIFCIGSLFHWSVSSASSTALLFVHSFIRLKKDFFCVGVLHIEIKHVVFSLDDCYFFTETCFSHSVIKFLKQAPLNYRSARWTVHRVTQITFYITNHTQTHTHIHIDLLKKFFFSLQKCSLWFSHNYSLI